MATRVGLNLNFEFWFRICSQIIDEFEFEFDFCKINEIEFEFNFFKVNEFKFEFDFFNINEFEFKNKIKGSNQCHRYGGQGGPYPSKG